MELAISDRIKLQECAAQSYFEAHDAYSTLLEFPDLRKQRDYASAEFIIVCLQHAAAIIHAHLRWANGIDDEPPNHDETRRSIALRHQAFSQPCDCIHCTTAREMTRAWIRGELPIDERFGD